MPIQPIYHIVRRSGRSIKRFLPRLKLDQAIHLAQPRIHAPQLSGLIMRLNHERLDRPIRAILSKISANFLKRQTIINWVNLLKRFLCLERQANTQFIYSLKVDIVKKSASQPCKTFRSGIPPKFNPRPFPPILSRFLLKTFKGNTWSSVPRPFWAFG